MKKSGPYKTYKGVIDPKTLKNPQKYEGDISNIVYRSMWEKYVIHFFDQDPDVEKYASEELFFYYENPITGKRSRYFPDFYVKLKNGERKVIEVKPKHQTVPPKQPARKTQKYLDEASTYVINQEKWKSAAYYCKKADMHFEVWTEDTLEMIGIMKSPSKILAETKRKPRKPRSPTRRPKRKS